MVMHSKVPPDGMDDPFVARVKRYFKEYPDIRTGAAITRNKLLGIFQGLNPGMADVSLRFDIQRMVDLGICRQSSGEPNEVIWQKLPTSIWKGESLLENLEAVPETTPHAAGKFGGGWRMPAVAATAGLLVAAAGLAIFSRSRTPAPPPQPIVVAPRTVPTTQTSPAHLKFVECIKKEIIDPKMMSANPIDQKTSLIDGTGETTAFEVHETERKEHRIDYRVYKVVVHTAPNSKTTDISAIPPSGSPFQLHDLNADTPNVCKLIQVAFQNNERASTRTKRRTKKTIPPKRSAPKNGKTHRKPQP